MPVKTGLSGIIIVLLFWVCALPSPLSRAAATIVGGLALGLERKTIVEFSFLLAIPTMLAATALDLFRTRAQLTAVETGYMIVGFAVSCAVAVASIKFFIRFIQRHDFIAFGIYRIVAALVLWRVIR
jgi:undecaprenyl-diphosphatase